MKRLLISFLAIFCLFEGGIIQCTSSTQQESGFLAFDAFFQEVLIDTLYIFTYAEPVTDPSLIPRSGDTTYSGRIIEDSLLHFLNRSDDVSSISVDADAFYGLVKFQINDRFHAYAVRFAWDGLDDCEIYLYVYDNLDNRFMNSPLLLASFYVAEGGEGEGNSWIFDYNKDGFPDVLSRHYKKRSYPDDTGLIVIEDEDYLDLKTWSKNEFLDTNIGNSEELKLTFTLRFSND